MNNSETTAGERENLRAAVESILNAYAVIYFLRNPKLGAVILAATFLAPTFGLFGLAGVMVAFTAAKWLGFAENRIRSGELLFNPLLSCMGLAYVTNHLALHPSLMLFLLPVVSISALLLYVAISHAMTQSLGLSCHSLPFVMITILSYLFIYSFTATPVLGAAPPFLLPEPAFFPASIAQFFRSFGAALYLPHVWIGVAIFSAILWQSRLTVLLAAFGFTVGTGFLHLTGLSANAFGAGWLGTNYLYCGIALGGVYFIPSRSSLVLAGFGAILSTIIAIGLLSLFRSYNIPTLSIPFLIVVFASLTALRQRERFYSLFESPYAEGIPEQNARRFQTALRRFPDALLPQISLPFSGERTVTQGFDGDITHLSHWRHAIDFEILDVNGNPIPEQRHQLEDAYTFGSPILAPCNGTVVRVVNHVSDNPLGEQNLAENWGNLAIIRTELGAHVLLCHFKQAGVIVAENQRVWRGQLLGYCGNSGRSPLPHLHVQVQANAVVGSPTVPFRIRNFITKTTDEKPFFRASGLPVQGSCIAPLEVDSELSRSLSFLQSTRVRYRTESAGQTLGWETIETESNGGGECNYRSVELGTALKCDVTEEALFIRELNGSSGSILGYFALGLSTVPFSKNRDICWEDAIPTRYWDSFAQGVGADLIEPFAGLRFLKLQSSFRQPNTEGETAIVTEVVSRSFGVPKRVEVHLAPGIGIVEVLVTSTTGGLRIVQEKWEAI